MSQSFVLLLVLWGILALFVATLAVWRITLSKREDDRVHLAEAESPAVAQQVEFAHKVEVLDKWGKTLTAVVVVYGLILAAYYMYRLWVTQTSAAF